MTAEELRRAFKYFFPEELVELQRLSLELPPNPVIINIGAGAGTSGLAFIECRDDSIIYTIDVENERSPLGSLFSERAVFAGAGFSNLKDVRWFQIHERSQAVGGWWRKKVNLVLVDGAHDYEGCAEDIRVWLPHLRQDGLLVVHDYDKDYIPVGALGSHNDIPRPKSWNGVVRAVDEKLIGKYRQISRVLSLITFAK